MGSENRKILVELLPKLRLRRVYLTVTFFRSHCPKYQVWSCFHVSVRPENSSIITKLPKTHKPADLFFHHSFLVAFLFWNDELPLDPPWRSMQVISHRTMLQLIIHLAIMVLIYHLLIISSTGVAVLAVPKFTSMPSKLALFLKRCDMSRHWVPWDSCPRRKVVDELNQHCPQHIQQRQCPSQIQTIIQKDEGNSKQLHHQWQVD